MSCSVFILLSVIKFESQIRREINRGNTVQVVMPGKSDLQTEDLETRFDGRVKISDCVNIKDVITLQSVLPAQKQIEYVFAFEEYCLLPAARLREALGIFGRKVEDVAPFRDKELMVRWLVEKKPLTVKVPYTERFSGEGQITRLVDSYGKVIAKRTDGMGSKDIQLFSQEQSEESRMDALAGIRKDKEYILQEFIDGKVYHYDTFIIGNIPQIDNLMEYVEHQFEYKHNKALTALSVSDTVLKRKLVSAAHEILKIYNLNNVVVHLELIYNGKDVYFCEIGIRPGGAGVVPAVKFLYGADLYDIDYLFQANRSGKIDAQIRTPTDVAGWSVIYPVKGVVAEISGLDELKKNKNIKLLNCAIKVGDSLSAQKHCASCVLLAVYTAEDQAQLKAINEAIYNGFSYKVI